VAQKKIDVVVFPKDSVLSVLQTVDTAKSGRVFTTKRHITCDSISFTSQLIKSLATM